MKRKRPEPKRTFGNRLPREPQKTLAIIIIGTVLIVSVHYTDVWLRRLHNFLLSPPPAPITINTAMPDICIAPPLSDKDKEILAQKYDDEDTIYNTLIVDEIPDEEFAYINKHPLSKGKIVVIIDDMGMDIRRSRKVINLPADLTLAFLPYAPKTPELSQIAKNKGHELMIHMPMEAMNDNVSLGGMGLKSNMSSEDFDLRLTEILNSFEGYVGANNHMGSKLTQDKTAMRKVMIALKKRDLFFIDSRTIHTSIADTMAQEVGIKHDIRDVFLDHVDTPPAVWANLEKAERIAHDKGLAILIGHPKDATIDALKKWLPTLKHKNIDIVSASSIVKN